jgi:hypothetical protein
MNNYYNNDNQYTDTELDNIYRKTVILDNLIKLYENSFESFHNGDLMVYNPAIFSKITRKQFIDWVINNNTELSNLFLE